MAVFNSCLVIRLTAKVDAILTTGGTTISTNKPKANLTPGFSATIELAIKGMDTALIILLLMVYHACRPK